MSDRPRIGISACLVGERVRYDGSDKHERGLVEALGRVVEMVPFCPEVEAGFGVPREPIQLVEIASPAARAISMVSRSGEDVTAALDRTVARLVHEAINGRLSGFVLKSRSPSCGIDTVPIVTSAGDTRSGSGIFVVALRSGLPALPIADEVALANPKALKDFIGRVLAYAERAR